MCLPHKHSSSSITPLHPSPPDTTKQIDHCCLAAQQSIMRRAELDATNQALPFATCYDPHATNTAHTSAAAAPQPQVTAPRVQCAVCILRKPSDGQKPELQLDCSVLHEAGFKTRQSASCIPVSPSLLLQSWCNRQQTGGRQHRAMPPPPAQQLLCCCCPLTYPLCDRTW